MVVLVILSVLAFFVAPEVLGWRPNMRLTDAAQSLYSNIQLAKLAAVKNNARAVVVFDAFNQTYEVFIDNGASDLTASPPEVGVANNFTRDGIEEAISSYKDEVTNTYTSVVSLPEGVRFFSNTNLGYDPRGLASPGGVVELGLIKDPLKVPPDPPGIWYRITVSAAGAVKMEKSLNGNSGPWE